MLINYKNRTVVKGQKVKVYFNLHKKVFSIKDVETGLVLAHGNDIVIESPTFLVNQKGRERVLRESQKNIHAFIEGSFAGINEMPDGVKQSYDHIYYNPYKQDKFTVNETNHNANNYFYRHAILSNKKVFAL
ncbi:hypothetical protein ACPA0F_18510 [Solibacillus silvestris]